MTCIIRSLFVGVLLSWLFVASPVIRAEAPTDEQLLELERQIEQQETEQAEAKKRAQAEAKQKAEAEAKRKEEEAGKQSSALAGEFVDIAGSSFQMGCSPGDSECFESEKPAHSVTVKPFRMGKYEVTFAQWDACVAAGGCGGYKPEDQGWGRGNRPVINVSWDDTQAFINWLNQTTGQKFRLPSEAEWEYAARAGTTTTYWWGGTASHEYANYGTDECCNGLAQGKDQWVNTSPVGSFPANAFGLFDTAGNVWEWTQDCWNESYNGAPSDGSAWTTGDCGQRVFRGGSWDTSPWSMRSSNRNGYTTDFRLYSRGFRLVQDLE